MKVNCSWKQKMSFSAKADEHVVEMDTKAPLGDDSAMSPKQLVLAGICGCTAMDVVSLLKKYRQPLESFDMEAESTLTDEHPKIFKEVRLTYRLTGALEPSKALEAVMLSQTKYCGVSAMIARACPIVFRVELNSQKIGSGEAKFR